MDRFIRNLRINLKQLFFYFWEIVILQGIISMAIGKRLYRLIVPSPLKSLKGETILITGAGNGIGKQIALQLANLGARIICIDIESEANASTVDELIRGGTKSFGYKVDLSNMEEIKSAMTKIRAEVGEISMVINNAGIVPNGPFLNMTSTVEERMIKVNVLSHFEIIREVLPQMIKKNHGHIITIASVASFSPAKELAGYTACKHANFGFIESLKQELLDLPCNTDNIQFTTVYPCFVQTRLMDGVTLSAKFPSNFPIVTPEFVAKSTVEAIRRDEEHLFIPKKASTLPLLRALIPTEAKKRLQKGIFKVEVTRALNNNNSDYYSKYR